MQSVSNRYHTKSTGFTIVELLIVIVVIAVLAAIALIAYNGVQGRAAESGLKSDLRNGSKQLGVLNATDGVYPPNASSLTTSDGTTFQYTKNDDNTYCLTGSSNKYGTHVFHIENGNELLPGACVGHGGGSDSLPECSGQAECLPYFLAKAQAYALSTDKSLGDLGTTEAAALAATIPGWTSGHNDAAASIGGDPAVLDPDGNAYGIVTPWLPDAYVIGVTNNDASEATVMWIQGSTGEVLFPPFRTGSNATSAFPALFGYFGNLSNNIAGNSDATTMTGDDLAALNVNPDPTIFSDPVGPAGGPWVITVSNDPSVPTQWQGCQSSLTSVDAGHIKFVSSTCL